MNSGLHTDCKTPHYAVSSVPWHIKISEVRGKMLVRSKCSNIFSVTWQSLFCTCCASLSRGKICTSTLTLRKVDVYSPCGKNELWCYSFMEGCLMLS